MPVTAVVTGTSGGGGGFSRFEKSSNSISSNSKSPSISSSSVLESSATLTDDARASAIRSADTALYKSIAACTSDRVLAFCLFFTGVPNFISRSKDPIRDPLSAFPLSLIFVPKVVVQPSSETFCVISKI